MRTIKFDCVVKDANGELGHLPYTLKDLQQGVTPERNTAVQEIVAWREWTGLKDKNGKEIYEGDIVGKNTKSGFNKQTIVWNEDGAGWDWETTTGDDWPDGFSGFIDEYEVIGNIYENPELLK